MVVFPSKILGEHRSQSLNQSIPSLNKTSVCRNPKPGVSNTSFATTATCQAQIYPSTMALDRIVSMALRAAELVFAAIVAGVTGEYLHRSHASSWDLGRFIYTEVVAALSILFALLWLIPFSGTFIHWPMDIFISILWWVSFGLLVDVSISLLCLPWSVSRARRLTVGC